MTLSRAPSKIFVGTGIALVLAIVLGPAAGHTAPAAIRGLGPRDALLVVAPSGETILAHNPDQPMVPASTLKLLTSLAAMHTLGADYRFPTDFVLDDGGQLGIKGYGDPILVSEVIAAIARHLAAELPAEIEAIQLDESYFAEPLAIPGVAASTNPYDAPNGALCANFNTVFFRTVNGQPQSAEAQTPLLPMVRSRIRRSGLTSGRIVLSRQGNEAVRYAGHLFRYFLEQEGITTRGEIRLGVLNITDADLLYRHRSPYDLRQVIRRLLEFSNNFTANQLLLAMGAHRYGPPATLEKGRRALNAYARDELGLKTGVFVEGSGISRLNRLSVRDMDTVLRRFAPHADLMSREGREYYKTGTLKGIRTRAGYIEVRPGVRFRFSLFRNQRGRTTGPVMRQIHHYLSVNQ